MAAGCCSWVDGAMTQTSSPSSAMPEAPARPSAAATGDRNCGCKSFGKLFCQRQCHITAHAMSDDSNATNFELLEHKCHDLGHFFHGMHVSNAIRLAVARQVNGNDPVSFGQCWAQRIPISVIHQKAVQ